MRSPRRVLLTAAVVVGLVAGQTPMAALATGAGAVASSSDGSGAVRNSITINRPAGTLPGHVMVASIVMSDDDPGFNAPPGWSAIRQDTIKDMLRQTVFVKVAGSDEPASYSWGVAPGRRLAGGITSFSGIDTARPVDVVSSRVNEWSTSVTAPGVTTTVPDTILVHLAAVASAGTITAPTGMTEAWEAAAPGASTKKNGKGAVVAMAYAPQAAVGPTGGRVATASGGARSIGVLLALRPVPGPDTSPPETTITSGPSGTTTNAFATFTFSATEAATFMCQLDASNSAEPCTSPKTYVNLSAGDHTFSVWATDTTGNADPSPATRAWTISPDTDDPVLVAAGDIAYCGNDNDEATAKLLDTMPGTIVTLGDNVYSSGTSSEFSGCYGPTWGRHKARTTPAAGNHEYVTPGASGYFDYFGAAAGDSTQGYYDYRLGAWHVIVLNSNCTAIAGCGAGSPQEQWLRSVLATSQAECTVAVWHHPRFSSGTSHGSNTAMHAFWQALYDYGADVVLNGHEHVYERFGMQAPDASADALYGLRQFTVGTGGRSSYGFGTPVANSDVRGRPYGVLKLTLRDTSYSWEFTPVPGQTFTDFGSSSCHGAPSPAPPPLPPPPPPPPPGGGIEVVGSTSDGSSTSRSTLGLARPTNTAAGNVLVASIATNADATILPSNPGWTVVRNDVNGVVRQVVYTRVVTDLSTEPASYQWTTPEGTRRITGGITAYSGVDTAHPIDAVAATLNGSSTSVSAPSLTTGVANTMLVQLVTINAEGTLTPPAGMTEVWEAASPNTGNTRDVLSSSSQALQAETGPTGTRVATASLPGASIGVLLALRPAG